MTRKSRRGAPVAEIKGDNDSVVDFLGAVVPLRAREAPGASPQADLSNVIPITSRRRIGPDKRAPELPLAKDDRPAPPTRRLERRRLLVLLVVGSFAIHASLFAAFNRPPPPLASLGEIVVSAELVIGTDRAAGRNKTPSQSEMDSPAAPKKEEPIADKAEAPKKAEENKKPEQTAKADEPVKTAEKASAPMMTAAAAPEPVADLPLPSKEPVETKAAPASKDKSTKPIEHEVEPKPSKKTKTENDDGKSDRKRATPASTPSASSNSIGRGRSDVDTNYRGIVAAHLARYKQFPSDARSRGDQGSATVTFSLDGSGHVTTVRLARGSGVASIDQETQAMVRRASPFPAPPGGRPQSFTVPVSFYLR